MEFDKYDHLNIANTAVFLSLQCVILGESNLLNSAGISHIYVCIWILDQNYLSPWKFKKSQFHITFHPECPTIINIWNSFDDVTCYFLFCVNIKNRRKRKLIYLHNYYYNVYCLSVFLVKHLFRAFFLLNFWNWVTHPTPCCVFDLIPDILN